jgi:hypothetical protein
MEAQLYQWAEQERAKGSCLSQWYGIKIPSLGTSSIIIFTNLNQTAIKKG